MTKTYAEFKAACDQVPNIIARLTEWIDKIKVDYEAALRSCRSGKRHLCIKVGKKTDNKNSDKHDLRFAPPVALKGALKSAGFDVPNKMTITWAICYVAGKHPVQASFECSHMCCDYDALGKREEEHRCIDPGCFTWESKSDNQSRANPTCHVTNQDDTARRTFCACAAGHNPPCH